jgi:diguanylate cyclase (GGDEF)-like protein
MRQFEKNWGAVEPDYIVALKSETALLNLNRLRLLLESILGLQLLTYLVLVIVSNTSDIYQLHYQASHVLYFILLLFSIVEYVLVARSENLFLNRVITTKFINRNLWLVIGFITTWSAVLSVVMSGNEVVDNVYLLSLMVTSFMFYVDDQPHGLILLTSISVYIGGHLIFSPVHLSLMDYLNLAVFLTLSWVISRMNYQSYMGFYRNQCIINDKNELLHEVNADLTTEVMEKQEIMRALETANATLRKISAIDELTSIPNRRKLNEVVTYEWRRSQRERNDIAIFMIDIDNFKLYNDTYGHVKGDAILRRVATEINRFSMRPTDFFGRYGGEEFTFIAINMDRDNILHFANRMRAAIEGLKIKQEIEGEEGFLTISIGATIAKPYCNDSVEKAFNRADMALYICKKEGKNTMRFVDVDDEDHCRKGSDYEARVE